MSKQPLLTGDTNGEADVAAHLEAGLGAGDVRCCTGTLPPASLFSRANC